MAAHYNIGAGKLAIENYDSMNAFIYFWHCMSLQCVPCQLPDESFVGQFKNASKIDLIQRGFGDNKRIWSKHLTFMDDNGSNIFLIIELIQLFIFVLHCPSVFLILLTMRNNAA